MCELEYAIFELIDSYQENDDTLEKIFHLIQIWGGRTGRWIYIKQVFHWTDIEPLYRSFVDYFRALNTIDEDTLNGSYTTIETFWRSLHHVHYKGMGIAFITKHSRFWMHKNLPDRMLPIYDSTFSHNVMGKGRNARLKDLIDYWRAMITKAEKEDVSLTALERQLFNYFNS